MTRAQSLARGREALRTHAWAEAIAHLTAADRASALAPADLEPLATAAQLVGKEPDAIEYLSRAHQGYLSGGETRSAARVAIRLAHQLLFDGDLAQSGGWLARGRRLLDACGEDCVERGYLLLPSAVRAVVEGNAAAAYAAFVDAEAIGRRFGDPDLTALALNGQGRALIRQGESRRGAALLDEAMIAVATGEVSTLFAGAVYCSVLDGCEELLDVRRAREWTAVLDQWCAANPDVVPYRGHCLLRHAEVLRLHGAWGEALNEAAHARDRLSQPGPSPKVSGALQQIAELHRLRGEFALAERAYGEASKWQSVAHPGQALLRLAQGQVDAAFAMIRSVAAVVRSAGTRTRVLDALVEIALAAGDVTAAREAADELATLAERLDAPWPRAIAAQAAGAVRLREGDAKGALDALHRACELWQSLEAPYEVARVRLWIALASAARGDVTSAATEREAARDAFRALGASSDVARLDALAGEAAAREDGPLTERERQVVGLVASGVTNREIAASLGISEKTVARHLSNIFVKLDVNSRAALTAYAFKNALV